MVVQKVTTLYQAAAVGLGMTEVAAAQYGRPVHITSSLVDVQVQALFDNCVVCCRRVRSAD